MSFIEITKDQSFKKRSSCEKIKALSPSSSYMFGRQRGHMISSSQGNIKKQQTNIKTEPAHIKNKSSIDKKNPIVQKQQDQTKEKRHKYLTQSIQEEKEMSVPLIFHQDWNEIQVNLIEEVQKLLQILIKSLNETISIHIDSTTTDLISTLNEKFIQMGRAIPIGYETINKNYPLDYFLTLPNKSLQSLRRFAPINLKPFGQYEEESSELSLNSFALLKCIGVGGFSRVFLARFKRTGQFLALKMVLKRFVQEPSLLESERDVMVRLSEESHPFLCQLYCVFETKRWVIFGVEYCPGSELFQYLRKVKKLSEPHARFYFLEVCMAILHLHQSGMIYRDIKPENILIDEDGHVKLGDFGLSRKIEDDKEMAYSFCGSPEYMAPEMLLKEGHNSQIDHYCLGALLYELIVGLPPYYSRNTDTIYKNILSSELQFPGNSCSDEVKDLITQLLQKDPSKRLGRHHGVYEILGHPWLKKIPLQQIMSRNLQPPYVPDQFEFNFDPSETEKDSQTFLKELDQHEDQIFKPFFQGFNFTSKNLQIQKFKRNSTISKVKTIWASVADINSSETLNQSAERVSICGIKTIKPPILNEYASNHTTSYEQQSSQKSSRQKKTPQKKNTQSQKYISVVLKRKFEDQNKKPNNQVQSTYNNENHKKHTVLKLKQQKIL